MKLAVCRNSAPISFAPPGLFPATCIDRPFFRMSFPGLVLCQCLDSETQCNALKSYSYISLPNCSGMIIVFSCYNSQWKEKSRTVAQDPWSRAVECKQHPGVFRRREVSAASLSWGWVRVANQRGALWWKATCRVPAPPVLPNCSPAKQLLKIIELFTEKYNSSQTPSTLCQQAGVDHEKLAWSVFKLMIKVTHSSPLKGDCIKTECQRERRGCSEAKACCGLNWKQQEQEN